METSNGQLDGLRTQVRLLWVYATVITIVVAIMAVLLFSDRGGNHFRELSAEKINIVEKDGTVKLALFNKENMPVGIVDDVKLPRSGGASSGLMFYNTEGEECGGLIYSSEVEKGHGSNGLSMTFDKYKQDQLVQLVSEPGNGGLERKGLQVNDRPAFPLSVTFHTMDSLQRTYKTDTAGYQAALQKLAAQGYFGSSRLFVGQKENNTGLFINDSSGAKRLAIFVDAENHPKIVFYDKEGKAVHEMGF